MAKCWLGAYIVREQSRFLPTTGTNASQCATCWSPEHWSRFVATTRTVAPHEPGPMTYTDEPGPLRGIGPGSEMNRERCLDERVVCPLVTTLVLNISNFIKLYVQ